MLRKPGIALIQTSCDEGSEQYRPTARDYAQNAVTFTSHGVDEYWQVAADAGFEPLAVVLQPRARYAYYLLRKS